MYEEDEVTSGPEFLTTMSVLAIPIAAVLNPHQQQGFANTTTGFR